MYFNVFYEKIQHKVLQSTTKNSKQYVAIFEENVNSLAPGKCGSTFNLEGFSNS